MVGLPRQIDDESPPDAAYTGGQHAFRAWKDRLCAWPPKSGSFSSMTDLVNPRERHGARIRCRLL